MNGRMLIGRVPAYQLAFAVGSALLVAVLAPRLLLLREDVAAPSGMAVGGAVIVGGLVGALYAWSLLSRHHALWQKLDGPGPVDSGALSALVDDEWRVTLGWLLPIGGTLAYVAVGVRPPSLDLMGALAVSLLAAVIVAAAALPLHVLVRASWAATLELVDFRTVEEVLANGEPRRLPRKRLVRRLVAAVVTPVAFVAFGCALIVHAHVRQAEQRHREDVARALARGPLDPEQVDAKVRPALDRAMERSRELGFDPTFTRESPERETLAAEDGRVLLASPTRDGAVVLRFDGAQRTLLAPDLLLINVLAVVVGALSGLVLGRNVSQDLAVATRSIRALDTASAARRPTDAAVPVRYQMVADLLAEVERLADRFRMFYRAHERALRARAAATRMRGLFFASISHDLKSPLNAILGFAEIVRATEQLTFEQLESLEQIERSGRELLALIETILDAARVEAGQLPLVPTPIPVAELLSDALARSRNLGGDRRLTIIGEVAGNPPAPELDGRRIGRALATLLGHALRTAEASPIAVRVAEAEPERSATAPELAPVPRLQIEIHVPGRSFPASRLAAMLDREGSPGQSEHRGLSLALALARGVVELHSGTLEVRDSARGSVFVVQLPYEFTPRPSPTAEASPPKRQVRWQLL